MAKVQTDHDVKVAAIQAEKNSSIMELKRQGEKDVLEATTDGERKFVSGWRGMRNWLKHRRRMIC